MPPTTTRSLSESLSTTTERSSSSSPTDSASGSSTSPASASLAPTTSSPSSTPTPSPSVASQAATVSATSLPSTEPSHVNIGVIIGGVAIALVILIAIFSGTIWWMRRRRTTTPTPHGATYEAAQRSHDPSNEETRFLDGGASASVASKKKRAKSRRMSSLGSAHNPGLELDEAYTMFGGSTTSFAQYDDEDDEPMKTHARRVSDPLGGRPSVERHRDGRYPSVGHGHRSASGRHSISFGVIDPFGDTSPKPFNRTLSTGAPVPSTPPAEGRRVSLSGGVGRVASRGSPVGSPKTYA